MSLPHKPLPLNSPLATGMELIEPLTTIEKIEELERQIELQPQIEVPVCEEFINGMYVRRIMIPEGSILTGRVHKYDYVDIMLSGDILIATPEGAKRLSGYNLCDGKAGRKRIGYALDSTEWITVHRTDIESDRMEEHLTFYSLPEYEVWADQQDYWKMLEDTGYTHEQALDMTLNVDDRKDIDIVGVHVLDSPINGKGVFAKRDFQAGEIIGPAMIDGLRTQIGRYTNHSKSPNAEMRIDGDTVNLIAKDAISVGFEIVTDYRHTIGLKQ